MSHSPAPWSVHPYADGTQRVVCEGTAHEFQYAEIAIGSGETLIGTFRHQTPSEGYPSPTLAEMHANARLAIAAPELLAALECLTESVVSNPDNHPSIYAAWQHAKLIIAKAKGGIA